MRIAVNLIGMGILLALAPVFTICALVILLLVKNEMEAEAEGK